MADALLKTAVIGASGYIGRHLLAAYRKTDPEALGTSCHHPSPDLVPFDLRVDSVTDLRLADQGYEAAILTSARPLIGYCEQHPEEARAVNVTGTLRCLEELGKEGLRVIFLSSDYVFRGDSGPYADDAETAPTTNYGRHKAEVERSLGDLVPHGLVVRLGKIYGVIPGDGTLLDEMATSLRSGRALRVATDQWLCPTWIDDLVGGVLAVQARGMKGMINLCAPERHSRAGMAHAVAAAVGASPELVEEIRLYDLPGMAGRPLDTSMLTARLQRELPDFSFLPLSEAIARVCA